MPQDTKNHFSALQLETLADTHFFDTKREVTEIIYGIFHDLQEELVTQWKHRSLSATYLSPAPKIFRGENYRNYPYVNLDFPRLFHSTNVFAYRTMMWWGHHFSFTLHLQGEAFEREGARLLQQLPDLKGQEFYFCVNDTPWEYQYDEKNFVPLDSLLQSRKITEITSRQNFIKISRRLAIMDYTDVLQTGLQTFNKLVDCLE